MQVDLKHRQGNAGDSFSSQMGPENDCPNNGTADIQEGQGSYGDEEKYEGEEEVEPPGGKECIACDDLITILLGRDIFGQFGKTFEEALEHGNDCVHVPSHQPLFATLPNHLFGDGGQWLQTLL